MGVIYKITNKINNKIYIGQTRLAEPQRWQQHLWYANNNPKGDCVLLCQAINKYGKENFSREVIENISNDLLNEREAYWIKFFNSTDKKIGYNIEIGGEGHCKITDEEIITAFQQYGGVVEASRHINLSYNQISKRLQSLGYITTREIPIKQYTVEGKFVAIYPTAAEASRQTGISASAITSSDVITAGGYIWLRDKIGVTIEAHLKKLKLENKQLRGIEQYDFNGNFIKYFSSAAEASKELGVNVSSIKAASNGRQATAGGFLWRKRFNGLSYEEMLNKFLLSPSCCAVEEINEQGEVIHLFESSNKAEQFYGWGGNMVKPVCDGKKKSTNGKYFRYANPKKRELLNINK